MRRDAKLRRDALIVAAAESFAARGYGVSLEEIAARAGVGRGTLYRNFKDREALALAIFEAEVDRIEVTVAHHVDLRQSLTDLALAGARGAALFARIATELVADTDNITAFEALGERLTRVLDPVAERGRASGDLRSDIEGETLSLALRMISTLFLDTRDEDQRLQRLNDALDLVLNGMRAR